LIKSNKRDIHKLYEESSSQQLTDLNKIIIALKTKISYLEQEIEFQNKIPVPRGVVQQILEIEEKNKKLEEQITYYKKYVPAQIIINMENKHKPTRKGGVPK